MLTITLICTPTGSHGTADISFRRDLTRALRWVSRHRWVLLPLLALLAIWPLYIRGMLRSTDGELHLLGLTFPLAFGTTLAALIVGSGLGMYLMARDVLGSNQRRPALVSAAALPGDRSRLDRDRGSQ